MLRWCLTISLAIIALPVRAADPEPKPTAEQIEFFEKKVRPILVDHCISCHGPKKQNAGLRLDTAVGLKAGADGMPVVVAGDPAKSKLIRSVKREGDSPMPPESKPPLNADAVAVLTEWVKTGAAFPDSAVKPSAVDSGAHWAFQPVRPIAVPKIRNPKSEIRNEIDSFVAAQLSDKGLSQSPRADKRTLIRRAYYDLTGLPPTADDVEAFENDTDPKAWERLIDRLLASPRYGERWGRYWLDLARYADTKGYVFNEDRNYPFAYTYRDYVIRSFNDDKPYDRFLIEQIAADKLKLGDDRRPLAALGFITLGRRFLNNQQDIIDDRIDVVTRATMGLTMSCARCHDHKFDPIPIADYYSLYGVFASSNEPKELPLIEEVKRTADVIAFEKEVEKREAEYRADLEKRYTANVKKLREPAVIADYLRAVLEIRGKSDVQIQAFARERDLNAFMLSRWRIFVSAETKSWSPVFGPLVQLADIPEKDYAAKSPALIAALGQDVRKPVNPIVRSALQNAKPKSLKSAVETVAGLMAATLVGPPTPAESEIAKSSGAGGPLDVALSDAEKLFNRLDREGLTAIRKKIDAFKAASPFAPARAHVLNDNASPMQPVVFLRGNVNNRGPQVPRQAPAIIAPDRKPFTDGSGRLELAKAIASPDNPLTARVMVNRVWAGHFGQGLVRTPSDFGTRSDAPTHPELLDWLAARFVKDGWSVKKLHALIMQSATYQQGSSVPAEVFKLDPENKWLTHQNRRRLDFEALRDSFLLATGQLDLTPGGRPVDLFKPPFARRRSVYGLIDRTNFPGTLRTFDVASPDQHAPQRFQTTVPQQALFLMNSPFVTDQARALAARPEVAAAESSPEKVIALYKVALGRRPTSEEIDLAAAFIDDDDSKSRFGKWPQLAQVLLLSNEFAFVD